MKVIAATGNPNKLREFRQILAAYDMKVLSLEEAGFSSIEVLEDGDSFEANSYKKAFEIMKITGMNALADDSGLAVDALGGAPGIYSARYAGEGENPDIRNNSKLLAELERVGASDLDDRGAQFICAITLAMTSGKLLKAKGEVKGRIVFEAVGNRGFGYDPLFMPDGYNITFGQMEAEEKNEISHRARALRNLEMEIQAEKI